MVGVLLGLVAGTAEPVPPVLVHRVALEQKLPDEGEAITIREEDGECLLYLPASWKAKEREVLTVHFHTAAWLPVREHLSRGLEGPLLVWNRAGASSAYRVPFADGTRWASLLEACREELVKRGAPERMEWGAFDVSSFSAGYGAVRELVKSPEFFAKVRRVVLCDSIYASLDASSGERKARRADVEAWFPLAEAAVRGEKTFLLTFSEVPTDYASSSECGAAIAAAVGGTFEPVPAVPPVRELGERFELLRRFDKGNLHLWQYPGAEGVAHVVHVHNLGALWRALDRAGQV